MQSWIFKIVNLWIQFSCTIQYGNISSVHLLAVISTTMFQYSKMYNYKWKYTKSYWNVDISYNIYIVIYYSGYNQ